MNTKYNLISLLQFYQQDVIGYILHIRGNTFLHHIIRKHGSVGGGGVPDLVPYPLLLLFVIRPSDSRHRDTFTLCPV